MSEFGHSARILGDGTCIDSWGSGPFRIEAGGKIFMFEDSDRFGPSILTKRGDIAARQPGEKSPFWNAHLAWVKQGRRLADDGVTAIFEPLKPSVHRILPGNILETIQEGDDGGEDIYEDCRALEADNE